MVPTKPPTPPRDDPERTTALGLTRYAIEFLETALAADKDSEGETGTEMIASVPVMYLTGHSIELALKAFLLRHGTSLGTLRMRYGHNLGKLWRAAVKAGLLAIVSLSDEEVATITVLDKLYSSKELEYIVTGAKEFPVYGPLQAAAIKLLRAVAAEVGYPSHRIPFAL